MWKHANIHICDDAILVAQQLMWSSPSGESDVMIPCCATMSEQMPQSLSDQKVNDRHVQSCVVYAGFGPITAGTAYGGRHLHMYAAPRLGPAALSTDVSTVYSVGVAVITNLAFHDF